MAKKVGMVKIHDPEMEDESIYYLFQYEGKEKAMQFKNYVSENYEWQKFNEVEEVFEWLDKIAREHGLDPLDFTLF